MKDFDIIAYIENNLEGPELEAFEKELQQNPDFAREVKLQRQLAEDIEMQEIRNIVSSALAEKDNGKGQSNGLTWGLGALIVIIAGLFFYLRNQPSQAPPETDSPVIQEEQEENAPVSPEPSIIEEETTTTPNEEQPPKEEQTTRPIASATETELPPPLYPSPNLRGSQVENETWKTLLDNLWYTSYPPEGMQFVEPFDQVDQLLKERNFSKAYVRLQLLERKIPENDSLSYLKGYCLLEMGEGTEALRYFNSIEKEQSKWSPDLDWYRGLATLLTGNKEAAVRNFEAIRQDSKHPFQQQAKKAVLLLE